MPEVIIGVDLGGTRIRAAQLDHHLNILKREEMLTLADHGLEPTITRIKDLIRTVLPEDKTRVRGIGISAPGPLNPMTGVIVAPPNLPGWHNVPLERILHEQFDIPVFLGNDANVAALAEAARGAASGYRHVIYITISTGIGSGVIVDGRLLLGREGLAAEFGHIALVLEDGRVSTPEKEAAGPALARRARMLISQGQSSVISELVNGDLDSVDGKIVGQAVAQGDKLALEVVQRGGRIVGLGIVTLLHMFNPEVIVIGGGVSRLWDTLYPPMIDAIKSYSMDSAYWQELLIERAGLGEDVSIIGAGALVATNGGVEDLTQVLQTLNG
jgi:glucokinase